MLATLTTKAIRDRWVSTAIGVTTLALFLLMGLAAYQEIDLAIYNEMPEAFRSIIGIPPGADATVLAFTAIYGSYGALTLAGIAISLGAGAIAGEERAGTLGLLLGNPRSRSDVLRAKAVSLVALTTLAAVALLGAGYAMPALLGVAIGEAQVAPLVAHMLLNSLFYGALALAVGAWTGRRRLASGVAAGVLMLGFVGAGILPLIESLADGVRLLPWHYYAGSDPFLNGVDAGHLAVLGLGTVGSLTAAWYGVNRRDLRNRGGGTSILDRLREHPLTDQIVERLAGSARVSAIWVKTTSEHQGLLIIVSLIMFGLMGVLMGPIYAAIADVLAGMSQLPEALLAIAGGGDMSTPEGWYRLETFGLMAPGAIMTLTIAIGARALAGEERQGTLGLLLANPVRRSRVVLEKVAAMLALALVVGAATATGVMLGSLIAGLGMDLGNIVAASFLATLLGLVFGALSLALGAATGRSRIATYGAIGVALLAYLTANILPLAESLAGYARWSPWYFYLGSDPLLNGMAWGDAAVLIVLAAVLVTMAVILFQRRDLRQG